MDSPAPACSRKVGNMHAAVMALGVATSSWRTMDEMLGNAGEVVLHNEIPRNGRYSLQQTFVRDRLCRRKPRALSNFSPLAPDGKPWRSRQQIGGYVQSKAIGISNWKGRP